MSSLKLFGMRAPFDELVTTAVTGGASKRTSFVARVLMGLNVCRSCEVETDSAPRRGSGCRLSLQLADHVHGVPSLRVPPFGVQRRSISGYSVMSVAGCREPISRTTARRSDRFWR